MAEVKEVGQEQFEGEVLQETLPVLVDFWAPWCGPCKMVAPIINEVADDFKDKLKVVKVNVDENPDLASRFNVMGIPTLAIFKGGELVESVTGAISKRGLEDKVSHFL